MNDSSISSNAVEGKRRSHKLWMNVEVALLCLLIIGVWILISVPIIFYHLPISERSSRTNGSINRTAFSGDSVCSAPLKYATSGICLTEFANILTSSNCPLDPEGNVLVVRNEEATATQLINGLTNIAENTECISKAVPFLCLHLFGLCGGSGVSIQPTTSQCEEIRDTLCQHEWVLVQGLGIDLPDCATFPAEASSCPLLNASNSTVTRRMPENYPSFPNRTTTVAVLECREGFYRENGSNPCIPSCYSWLLYSKGLSIFIDVVIFTCAFIGFLASAAVIIISCLAHKRMLSFPSIFIVYIVIDIMALTIFVMVNYTDRSKLFCSSRSLIESLREVTPFCVISGILFTYVLDQLAFWCLFHTITLFWMIKFPFHARAFEISGKIKYIHITCIILGVIFPLIPIITTMADFAVDVQKQNENSTSQLRNSLFLSGGLGFRSTRSPSILCTATSQDGIFYSLALPMDIILGFISTLIIIIFWSVHRQNINLKTNGSSNPFRFGTAEKKLLIVFCYYELLAAIALTTFILGTRNASQIVKTVQRYFICEQGGHDPSHPCSRSEIEDEELTYPSLTTLSYILLALFPVVNLVYVVNIEESKELWRKCFPNKKKSITTDNTTGSNVVIPLTLKRMQ